MKWGQASRRASSWNPDEAMGGVEEAEGAGQARAGDLQHLEARLAVGEVVPGDHRGPRLPRERRHGFVQRGHVQALEA
jgi:hypothetical protein